MLVVVVMARGGNFGVIVVRVREPVFRNLLAFEKTDPFIYFIVRNVDLKPSVVCVCVCVCVCLCVCVLCLLFFQITLCDNANQFAYKA